MKHEELTKDSLFAKKIIVHIQYTQVYLHVPFILKNIPNRIFTKDEESKLCFDYGGKELWSPGP